MGRSSKKIIGDAIKDPEKFYKAPESILTDVRLTQAEKDKILHSWEQDQIALLRAAEENMMPRDNGSPPEDMLERIKKAEWKLKGSTSQS